MAQKHLLHELLKEDQEPFVVKNLLTNLPTQKAFTQKPFLFPRLSRPQKIKIPSLCFFISDQTSLREIENGGFLGGQQKCFWDKF